MKLLPKSRGTRFLLLALLLWLIAMAGPSLVHWVYRLRTSEHDKTEKQERYQQVANGEIWHNPPLSEAELKRSQEERLNLYDWFHVRGWNIDEDDEATPWYQPWQELFRYWMNPPLAEVPKPTAEMITTTLNELGADHWEAIDELLQREHPLKLEDYSIHSQRSAVWDEGNQRWSLKTACGFFGLVTVSMDQYGENPEILIQKFDDTALVLGKAGLAGAPVKGWIKRLDLGNAERKPAVSQ